MERRRIPNQLTMLRLIVAGVFFLVLNLYRYGVGASFGDMPQGGGGGDDGRWLLLVAAGLFVLAAVTDAADGYLARRWKVESKFGRIMDPFCDKILILGAVIYLASPRFLDHAAVVAGHYRTMVSGVYPWMVVLVVARELLVTGIRGEVERQGVAFGANWFGKAKMILQSLVVPVVLVIVFLDPNRPGQAWLGWVRDVLVYATVVVTVVSGVPYVTAAARVLRPGAVSGEGKKGHAKDAKER